MQTFRRALSVLLLASSAVGCSVSVAAGPPTPAPASPAASPAPMPAVASLRADWIDDEVEVRLDNGWVVRGCEGAAPLLCVHDGDRILGDVELGQFPAGEELLTDDPVAALLAHGRDFLAGMEEDRAVGCPAFAFEAMPPTSAVVDGGPAARMGFALRDGAGREVERVIVHVTVRDGTLWSVTASAYVDEGGCLPSEQDFDPATLAVFEPALDALVRGTPLPTTRGAGPSTPAEPLAAGVG